jgi:hypothetical protein
MLHVDDAGVACLGGFRLGIGSLAAAEAEFGESAHVCHQRGETGRSTTTTGELDNSERTSFYLTLFACLTG